MYYAFTLQTLVMKLLGKPEVKIIPFQLYSLGALKCN